MAMALVAPAHAVAESAGTRPQAVQTDPWADADGPSLMRAVRERGRQYPYAYEELAMILIDKEGRHRTRRVRRFTRARADGSGELLVLFDLPETVGGVALLAHRDRDGRSRTSLYLPALGPDLVEAGTSATRASVLGTDFSVEDLVGERLDGYRFMRRADETISDTGYYVVDAHALDPGPDEDPPLYRHYILKDSLIVIRTDTLDAAGRLLKRHTRHDFQHVGGQIWLPNLLMMRDAVTRHRSLLRVERRVFSRDYVPDEVFSATWLRRNYPPVETTE